MFACGRYEGIDQRVVDDAARRVRVDEVSIGDYVLVGGEVAVLAIVEAVARLLPGVLGNPKSHAEDSFQDGLLEGPSYTRPEVWRELAVPDVLRSGNHKLINRWRRDQSLARTFERRPDLLESLPHGGVRQARPRPAHAPARRRGVSPISFRSAWSGTLEQLPQPVSHRRAHQAEPPSCRAQPWNMLWGVQDT